MYMEQVSNGVLLGEKVIPYDVIGAVGIVIALLGLVYVVYEVGKIKKSLE